MLSLIRKIRRQLIESGSVRKYFFYATGEILLVMIGILLALQVNNWNTDRLNSKIEKEYVARLSNELQSEIAYLERIQSIFELKRDRLSRIVKIWYSDEPNIEDSLQYITDFRYSGTLGPWYNEPITWTQLVQTGDLKLIKDQKLIDGLFLHYNSTKKAGNNYAQHPMSMTNEARRILPPIFMDKDLNIFFDGGIEELKEIPDKKFYERIWKKKDDLIDLYATIAYISNVNYLIIGGLIKSAKEMVEYIETK